MVAERYGVSLEIVQKVRNWSDNVSSCVTADGEHSDWFRVENRERLGSVLSSTFFSI